MTFDITENITIRAVLSSGLNETTATSLMNVANVSNGSIQSYGFRLTDLTENVNYTITFDLNFGSRVITSTPFPLCKWVYVIE